MHHRAILFAAALLSFTMAGAALFWPARGATDLVVSAQPSAPEVRPGTELSVLRVRPGRRPTTLGRGRVLGDGRVAVRVFSGLTTTGLASEGLLLRADLPALWAVATDTQRDAVRAAALIFVSDVFATLDEVVASPQFATRYRPLLNDVFTDAVDAAWREPETQAALGAATRASQQAALGFLTDDLRPALMDRVPSALWQTLSANATSAFGLLSGGRLDLGPLEKTVDAVLSDDAVIDGLRRAMREVAASPEVDAFARALARGSVRALNRDHRLQQLLVDIFRDPDFQPQFRRIGSSAVAMLESAQSQIAGLGAASQVNALAAAVFRGLVRGDGEMVLVLADESGAP